MFSYRINLPLVSLLITLISLSATWAQQPDDDPYHAAAMENSISVEFTGGAVRDYISLVKKAAPAINVVITGSAGEYMLPDIELKNVPAYAALECITRASQDRIFTQQHEHVVYVEDDTERFRDQVRVINVKQLLTIVDKADLLTAIEVGLEMQGDRRNKVELKLHEETGLLFIKGQEDQTNMVNEVVHEMSKGAMIGFAPGGLGGGAGATADRRPPKLGRGASPGGGGASADSDDTIAGGGGDDRSLSRAGGGAGSGGGTGSEKKKKK